MHLESAPNHRWSKATSLRAPATRPLSCSKTYPTDKRQHNMSIDIIVCKSNSARSENCQLPSTGWQDLRQEPMLVRHLATTSGHRIEMRVSLISSYPIVHLSQPTVMSPSSLIISMNKVQLPFFRYNGFLAFDVCVDCECPLPAVLIVESSRSSSELLRFMVVMRVLTTQIGLVKSTLATPAMVPAVKDSTIVKDDEAAVVRRPPTTNPAFLRKINNALTAS